MQKNMKIKDPHQLPPSCGEFRVKKCTKRIKDTEDQNSPGPKGNTIHPVKSMCA